MAGLAKMMASKVVELLKKLPKKSVVLVGGSSRNKTMIHYLAKEIEDLLHPRRSPLFRGSWSGSMGPGQSHGPLHRLRGRVSEKRFGLLIP